MASDEWSQDDFIERMKKQFPKDVRDGDISILSSWMRIAEFNIFQREMLFNLVGIKHPWRTFPLPAKIRVWWEKRDGGPQEHVEAGVYGVMKADIIKKTGTFTPKKISKIYDKITEQYIGKQEPVPAIRMMYIIFWEPLVTWFKLCIDKGWMEELADSYCEPIRDKLINGEEVGYNAACIEDKRSPEELAQGKAAIMGLLSQVSKNLRLGRMEENRFKAEKRTKSLENDRERDK